MPTRANAQPAFGLYLRAPDGTRAGERLVRRHFAGDRVSSLIRFEASVFPWFGLPYAR